MIRAPLWPESGVVEPLVQLMVAFPSLGTFRQANGVNTGIGGGAWDIRETRDGASGSLGGLLGESLSGSLAGGIGRTRIGGSAHPWRGIGVGSGSWRRSPEKHDLQEVEWRHGGGRSGCVLVWPVLHPQLGLGSAQAGSGELDEAEHAFGERIEDREKRWARRGLLGVWSGGNQGVAGIRGCGRGAGRTWRWDFPNAVVRASCVCALLARMRVVISRFGKIRMRIGLGNRRVTSTR